MVEDAEKNKEEMSKEEFFKSEIREAKQAQGTTIITGWIIIAAVAFAEILIPPLGIVGTFFNIFILFVTFFLVMYFIWSPYDVCWGSQPREGYTKAILSGNVLDGFINCPSGKAFTSEWDIVDDDHPDALSNNHFVILGMYIIPYWPFAKIYWEKTEWERYYPNEKKALPRRELLKEFTLLPYPYYIEIIDAEDKNRLGITLITNVVMRIINPKKALFRQTTTWIDIIKPIIQGGYVSYLKGTTFQEMIGNQEDIGNELLKKMKDPSGKYLLLIDMIEDVYGIKIESISVLDIVGSDKDEQDAIKAKALAELNRDAALVNADSKSRKSAIEIMGLAIKMLVQMVVQVKDNAVDQQIEYAKAENEIKSMIRDNPKAFEETYGENFKRCLDFVQREMALGKDSLVDVRSPDAKGSGAADLLTMLATSNMLSNKNSEKKGKI